jgi:hypothetical protein
MNSDITSTQNVSNTNNPQTASGNVGASDSAGFQESANASILNSPDLKSLTVTNSGQKLSGEAASQQFEITSGFIVAAIFVVAVIAVLVAAVLMALARKQPSLEDDIPLSVAKPVVHPAAAVPTHKKQHSKKKRPRSRRHK